MKRIAYVWLAAAILATTLVTLSGAQSGSLGDYAREARKLKGQKPPVTKQFDNDNLPKTDKLSIVGNAAEMPAAKPANQTQPAAQADKSAQPKDEEKDSAAERQKGYKEWQKKIASQRSQMDLLARELDVLQREYRLRAAAFYADAGNRLRNQADWDKEDSGYKQKIADKQKAYSEAKQQVEDLQERARKAGVPAAMRE